MKPEPISSIESFSVDLAVGLPASPILPLTDGWRFGVIGDYEDDPEGCEEGDGRDDLSNLVTSVAANFAVVWLFDESMCWSNHQRVSHRTKSIDAFVDEERRYTSRETSR